MFNLGDVLKDNVTGFVGVAMARSEYYTGCTHYGLCSQNLKDGKPLDWEWFDDTRLTLVERNRTFTHRPSVSGDFPSPPGC